MEKFRNLESNLLGLFIFVYVMIVWPNKIPFVFSLPRLDLLLGFLIIAPLIRMLSSPETRFYQLPKLFARQPLYIKLLPLLAVLILISTLLSSNAREAWFGGDSIQAAGYFYLLLIPLFWVFSTAKAINTKWIAGAGVLIFLLTIIEFLGFRPFRFVTDVYMHLSTSFPAVTVGHRGQLAGLLVLLGFYSIYNYKAILKKPSFLFYFLLFSIALGCTTNSTAIIASLFSILALLIWQIFTKQRLAIILPFVFILGYFLHFPLENLSKQLYSMGIVKEESGQKAIGDTYTLQTRKYLWTAGLNMWKAKPLFGWGAQSYSLNWYNHLPPKDVDKLIKMEIGLKPNLKYTRIDDVIAYGTKKSDFENHRIRYFSAHNGYIDFLYNFGILGFGIVILIGISILYSIKTKNNKAILIFIFLPYMIYLLAWFVTVPATGVGVMLLGILIAQIRNEEAINEK